MIIFVVLLTFFGLIVPWLVARMLCDILRISNIRLRIVILAVIIVGNWQWWQAPPAPNPFVTVATARPPAPEP